MATQTKIYHIEYRKEIGDDFQLLHGADTDNRVQIDEVARAYAEDHPDAIVRIYGGEDFEIQYRYKNFDQRMHYSFGNGWIPYG